MHYHYDGEEICEMCLTAEEMESSEPDYGEQDCPANCARCRRPLDYLLTSDGVQYVLEQIRERFDRMDVWPVKSAEPDDYYKDMRHIEVLRDWAEDLSNYKLSRMDKVLVGLFLRVSEVGYQVHPQEQELIDLLLEVYDG